MRICSVPGCGQKHSCGGLCKRCYMRRYYRENRELFRAAGKLAEKRPPKTPCARCTQFRAKKTAELCGSCYRTVKTQTDARWRAKRNARAAVYNKNRYGRVVKACPSWADRAEILKIYENCPAGHDVDHIVPIKGKTVSGLHVPWNLQYLPSAENRRKGNRF